MYALETKTERNKVAVENVFIIVQLIEQAGDNIPRIKASTLIERNPQLQERLENSTNKRQQAQRYLFFNGCKCPGV